MPADILEHLDHVDCLEVAWYPVEDPESVTVECTRCNVVIVELFSSGED